MRLKGFVEKGPAPTYKYSIFCEGRCVAENFDHDGARRYFNSLDGYVVMYDNHGRCADFKGGAKPEPEEKEEA